MSRPAPALRPATRSDADALAGLIVEGFAGYRAFAPGWSPPRSREQEAVGLRDRLAHPETWGLRADDPEGVAGFSLWVPGHLSRDRPADPRLAHLIALFVTSAWRGTGLAVRLLGAARSAAHERGFSTMRLFTPALHARARRFYEREGWEVAGPPTDDPFFGLALVEYRTTLVTAP